MDYGKSFTFTFQDEKWISKFAVGVIISLVPIVNFAGYGYMVQLLKNVRDGEEYPLPEWDDFGKLFVDGLKLMLGYLVYFIPVFLLSFALIPFAIAADSGGTAGEALGLVVMCISCLVTLIAFLPLLLYPALYIQYAKDDQIGDMFKFGEMWDLIKGDTANYIIVLLMFLVLALIAFFVGILICFVGVIVTTWWAQLASAHMIGQLAQPKEKPATI